MKIYELNQNWDQYLLWFPVKMVKAHFEQKSYILGYSKTLKNRFLLIKIINRPIKPNSLPIAFIVPEYSQKGQLSHMKSAELRIVMKKKQ
jgi:hypothetical protein